MNTPILIQKLLMAFCLLGAATLFALLLAYCFRHHLRRLNERWRALNPATRCLLILFVTAFVLYGGSKSPTNDPPIDIEGDVSAPTNAPPEIVDNAPAPTNQPPPLLLSACCSPLVMSAPPQLTNQPTNQLTNWSLRGAYSDWHHIDFPSSFAFPHGTNLLTSVTLFAWDEIREEVKVRGEGEQRNIQVSFEEEESDHHRSPSPSTFTLNLPTAVSLSPGESSVTYGLTPSNSFLIAWQNVCVNRSPTNRVDASIELFPSGVCSVRFGASQTDYPPTPPPGFVGSGQDTNWLASVFSPTDYTQITNKGYDAWLSEDYVGVNEQNGLYKASITIDQQPTTNNQQPLYLVCGPYKVVVTSPGTYSFPLEVFKHYRTRTYPVALPLSISTDDGYRDNLAPALLSYACCSPTSASNAQFPTPSLLSGSSAQSASRPRLALSAPPNTSPEYDIYEEPRLVISPDTIPLNQAVGTHISIWCNIASTARRYGALISREFRLNFCNPSDAEIVAAEVEDLVEIIIDAPLGTCVGTVSITDLHSCCECGSCTGPGCSCGCGCWCHQSSNDTSTNSPSATP